MGRHNVAHVLAGKDHSITFKHCSQVHAQHLQVHNKRLHLLLQHHHHRYLLPHHRHHRQPMDQLLLQLRLHPQPGLLVIRPLLLPWQLYQVHLLQRVFQHRQHLSRLLQVRLPVHHPHRSNNNNINCSNSSSSLVLLLSWRVRPLFQFRLCPAHRQTMTYV